MNDSELNRILKAARVPDRPGEFWDRLPKGVAARLHWQPSATAESPRARRWLQRLSWGCALMGTCLAVGFWSGQRHASKITVGTLLQNEKLIRETLSMFPNRVRAIVQDERGVTSLVLSDSDDVPVSTPLWVEIQDGKRRADFVTFSGQQIQVHGRSITVLDDARGGVMLVGNDFVWSSADQAFGNISFKVQGKSLGSIVL